MNLGNILRKDSQRVSTNEQVKAADSVSRGERLMRLQNEVRSLKPGQTLQGTVVGRNGNSVQIELAQDYTINAKIDKSVSLALGQLMSFEIKTNTGFLMSLAPLYTNTANSATILRALAAAGLPETSGNMEMVAKMMEEGMPIDKDSVLNMSRLFLDFPGKDPTTLVQLTRLQLPVTEANIEQFEQYRNASHQILGSAKSIMEELPRAFMELVNEGQGGKAAALYAAVIDIFTEGETQGDGTVILQGTPQTGRADGQTVSQGAQDGQTASGEVQDGQTASGEVQGSQTASQQVQDGQTAPGQIQDGQTVSKGAQDGQAAQNGAEAGNAAANGPEQNAAALGKAVQAALPEDMAAQKNQTTLPDGAEASVENEKQPLLTQSQWERLGDDLQRLGADEQTAKQVKSGGLSTKDVLQLVRQLIGGGKASTEQEQALHRLLGGKEFQTLLKDQIGRQWTIEPKDVADKKQVEQLYERIREQTAKLSQALETAGKSDAPVARSVQNLQNNVDFMNQMNHLYTYVQLPLKMLGNNAHGDLYVYTNKKNLAARDGQVSALLHLDMEHLGPLDVYVTMKDKQVATNFTVADDSILGLIEENIDILNKRLTDRGYSLKAQMHVREDEEAEEGEGSIMQTILHQQKNISVLSRTSFDMRA